MLKIDFGALGISRIDLMNQLKASRVHSQVHYIPVHLQPYYQKNFGTGPGDCPEAEKYYSQCLSLPLFSGMTDAEIAQVIKKVSKISEFKHER